MPTRSPKNTGATANVTAATLREYLSGFVHDLAGFLAIILIVFAFALVVTDLAQLGLAIQGRG